MRNENDGKYKKKREDFGKYPREVKEPEEGVVFGRNAVKELLASGKDVDKILVARGEREGSISMLVSQSIERGIPLLEVDRKKLDVMCAFGAHQGIVAMASLATYVDVDEILAYAASRGEAPMLVICDGVEDPHNLGAIIRSAECAGFHGVIIPKRHSATVTATVAKSSAGAIAHMRIAKVANLATTIDVLKKQNIWIYGADMDGSVYYETDLKGPIAIVLGSEGTGISRLVEEKCDFRLSIPLYGKVDSMNVSAAAAVLFSEAARQHYGKK